MPPVLRSLRTRLVLAAAVFLLSLTAAVILVVRDSLVFAGRNVTEAASQTLQDQRAQSLLAIARREAELLDLNGLSAGDTAGRLDSLDLSPSAFAFLVDGDGRLLSVSQSGAARLLAELPEEARGEPQPDLNTTLNVGLFSALQSILSGQSGTAEFDLPDGPVKIAYVPLPVSDASLALVEPAAEITANAAPLGAEIEREIDSILRATLTTIAYFTVLALIGVVLAARGLTQPIRALVEGTQAVARGSLDVRIPVSSADELGELAVSFNTMAENLRVRTREWAAANEAAVENARLYEQARALATVEERQRLARELHDSVTQSLYSLTLLAEAGRRTALAGDGGQVAGLVARLGETAQQALKEMRLLVYQLRPVSLEREGLVGAIRQRLDAVERRAGLQAELRADPDSALPAEVEHDLYRIAQEALNNALKHAGASAVSVEIRIGPASCELEIRDDGRGFDPDAAGGGLGLGSIRERAAALGGEARILSSPGGGTRVTVRVPLPGSEAAP